MEIYIIFDQERRLYMWQLFLAIQVSQILWWKMYESDVKHFWKVESKFFV